MSHWFYLKEKILEKLSFLEIFFLRQNFIKISMILFKCKKEEMDNPPVHKWYRQVIIFIICTQVEQQENQKASSEITEEPQLY